ADIHAADGVDLVEVDLGEDDLLLDAAGKVAAAVECVAVDAAEVTDTGQRHVEETVDELVHTLAAQGDLAADGGAGAQLEVCDGLLGAADDGLLAGDLGQVLHDRLQDLLVFLGLAASDVDHDLVELGDLHDALVAELLVQSRSILIDILVFQTSHCSLLLSLQLSAALLADADHLAVLFHMAHAHGLAALGADGHHLGRIHGALGLDDAALLALTAGLDVLGDHVLAFNDDLAFGGADLQHLAGVALVLAADDHDVVAGF